MRKDARKRRTPVRRKRGERGSVLMEGVLVLPIYLMVLGALFLMGDLARGRLQLLQAERFLAWIGVDRWEGHGADAVNAQLAAFLENEPAELADRKLFAPDGDGTVYGSHWAGYVLGYGILDVPVPWWFGMANAEQVSRYGNSDGELAFRDRYLVPGRGGNGAQIHWRSALFRRLPAGEIGRRFDRNAPEEDLMSGVVWNVAGDAWCGLGAQEERAGTDPDAWAEGLTDEERENARREYVRVNDMVSMGE